MISPVLSQGSTSVEVYFPQQNWFDFYTFQQVSNGKSPMNITLDTPLEKVQIHIMGSLKLRKNSDKFRRRNHSNATTRLFH